MSCVPHRLRSKDFIKFSLYMSPVRVSNKLTVLKSLAFFKSRTITSVPGDQTLVLLVFGAVSPVCTNWSTSLASTSTCEVARASTDITSTASVVIELF